MIYNIIFSETAAEVRNSLPEDRQTALRRALLTLADDPRTKVSSTVRGDDNARSIALTSSLAIDYIINDGMMIVLVIHIVDTDHVLVED